MFSRALEQFQRTVSIRLSSWYAGIFVASLLLLYGAIHLSLIEVLTRNEHTTLNSFVGDFQSRYAAKGVKGVQGLSNDKRSHIFLVRISSADGKTVFFASPDRWDMDYMPVLEALPFSVGDKWQRMSVGRGDTLDIQTENSGRSLFAGWRQRSSPPHFPSPFPPGLHGRRRAHAPHGWHRRRLLRSFHAAPHPGSEPHAREIVQTGNTNTRLAPRGPPSANCASWSSPSTKCSSASMA